MNHIMQLYEYISSIVCRNGAARHAAMKHHNLLHSPYFYLFLFRSSSSTKQTATGALTETESVLNKQR
jgi:hypothetical protein